MTTLRWIGIALLATSLAACGAETDDDGGGDDVGGTPVTGGEQGPEGGEMASTGGAMQSGGTLSNGGAIPEGGTTPMGGNQPEGGAMEPDPGGIEVPMGGQPTPPDSSACAEPPPADSFYAFSATSFTRQGTEVSMCEFSNRVVLVVNTAANCGLTPQYEWLQQMDDRYRTQGLSVLGFLSNDFRNQGGTDDEVEACEMQYGVKFEQFNMVGVTPNSDRGQHPLFAWLTNQPGLEGVIPWNFSKFLVSHDGRLLARWSGAEHFASMAAAEQAIQDALMGVE